MRHYEIVLLVHPDQSDQVPAMVDKYQAMVTTNGGAIHRIEDWGRRLLAYPINKMHKAHYILLNIECDADILKQLTDGFFFNDAVIRNLVIRRDRAFKEPSLLAKSDEEGDDGDDAEAQEPESVEGEDLKQSDAQELPADNTVDPVEETSGERDETAEDAAATDKV